MTTRGFDANVPARKPRTISRVLTELTSGPDNGTPAATLEDAAIVVAYLGALGGLRHAAAVATLRGIVERV